MKLYIKDYSVSKAVRPPATPGEQAKNTMFTHNNTALPHADIRQEKGVRCGKCGHKHKGGNICSFDKSFIYFYKGTDEPTSVGKPPKKTDESKVAEAASNTDSGVPGHKGGNPYHDEGGKFTTKEGAASKTTGAGEGAQPVDPKNDPTAGSGRGSDNASSGGKPSVEGIMPGAKEPANTMEAYQARQAARRSNPAPPTASENKPGVMQQQNIPIISENLLNKPEEAAPKDEGTFVGTPKGKKGEGKSGLGKPMEPAAELSGPKPSLDPKDPTFNQDYANKYNDAISQGADPEIAEDIAQFQVEQADRIKQYGGNIPVGPSGQPQGIDAVMPQPPGIGKEDTQVSQDIGTADTQVQKFKLGEGTAPKDSGQGFWKDAQSDAGKHAMKVSMAESKAAGHDKNKAYSKAKHKQGEIHAMHDKANKIGIPPDQVNDWIKKERPDLSNYVADSAPLSGNSNAQTPGPTPGPTTAPPQTPIPNEASSINGEINTPNAPVIPGGSAVGKKGPQGKPSPIVPGSPTKEWNQEEIGPGATNKPVSLADQVKQKDKYDKTYNKARKLGFSHEDAHAAANETAGSNFEDKGDPATAAKDLADPSTMNPQEFRQAQKKYDLEYKRQKNQGADHETAHAAARDLSGANFDDPGDLSSQKPSQDKGKPWAIPFSQAYGAGAAMGSSLATPGGSAAPTAAYTAQRAHQLLNPDLRPHTAPAMSHRGIGSRKDGNLLTDASGTQKSLESLFNGYNRNN